MEKWSFRILGTLLMLIAISESGVIKENSSGDDKKLGLHPGIGRSEEGEDDFGVYEFDMGDSDPHSQPDYDNGKPGEGSNFPGADKDESGIIKPEKIPPIEKPIESDDDNDDDIDKKLDEEGIYEPFDGEEDIDKSVDGNKDTNDDEDVGESHHSGDDDVDDDEKIVDEDEGDKKISEGDEDDEEVPEEDEDKKEDVDDDDEKPDEDDEPDEDEEKSDGFFHGGPIRETPFFNLEQVQKYFNQLEKALGHVFKQTLDEAILLNGTYANTTEEEVEINGKKYIVKKSLIKGTDNDSSLYVEALSTKPKSDSEEKQDAGVVNVTHT